MGRDQPYVRALKMLELDQDAGAHHDFARAQVAVGSGAADAITFGRKFLANPDLPNRFANDLPLNADDQKTWYSQGPEGYVTYPAYG